MQEGLFHWSTKAHSRSKGRSATGCAAYRAGIRIVDERTGLVFDYRRKSGVSYSEVILPADAPVAYRDRATLWNAVEQSETRINSTVCKELEIALPNDLPRKERERLITTLVREIVDEFGFAAEVDVHSPHSRRMADDEDTKNEHAHVLLSCRKLTAEGFTNKNRDWDSAKTGGVIIDRLRGRWAELVNAAYREHGIAKFIDHRSFEERGIDRVPTKHEGTGPRRSERRAENMEIRAINATLSALEREEQTILAELTVLMETPAPVEPVLEPVAPVADDALGLDALVLDYEQCIALRQGARTYGRAKAAREERAGMAMSLKRELDEMEPPRFAIMHQWLSTPTWERYTEQRDDMVRRQTLAQTQADKLAGVMRDYRRASQDWDSKGYARHKEIVAELLRVAPHLLDDSDRPAKSPQSASVNSNAASTGFNPTDTGPSGP